MREQRMADPVESYSPIVKDWLLKAQADYEAVYVILAAKPTGYPDLITFHTQQCLEKLLKVALIINSQAVGKTHDLKYLAKLAVPFLKNWEPDWGELSFLTDAGITARYPETFIQAIDLSEVIDTLENHQTSILACLGLTPFTLT